MGDDVDLVAAKRKVGGAARQMLEHARTLMDLADRAAAAPANVEQAVRHRVGELLNQQTTNNLRQLPASKLREAVRKGVRFGELEKYFHMVADVVAVPPSVLQTVPGIGPSSAQEIHQAAWQLATQVRGEVSVRFDPDRPGRGETHLLGLLVAWRDTRVAATALHALATNIRPHLQGLSAAAEPAGSRAKMLFSGKTARTAALTALARLEQLLTGGSATGLHQRATAVLQLAQSGNRPAAEVWREYERDAAGINALLATIPGAIRAADDDAAHGFAPAELVKKIQAVPLNTDRLKTTLRGYQVFGAQYAILQERTIIGDEMGLGKTIQALATAAHLAANGRTRFLVVCPASVLINWINEIGKHTTLTAHALHGADRDGATRVWSRRGGVAVTTFGTVSKLPLPDEHGIQLLIVDEAHYIKNKEAQRSRAVAALATNAERTLFLTGTPMENRVEEFQSLVDHLRPGIASSLDRFGRMASATTFRRAVAPVYLRRNQEDVLQELPECLEMEDWVQLSDADERVYRVAVERNFMAMRQAAYATPNHRDSAKMVRLLEIIEESKDNGWKVIVFSYFRGVLEAVQQALAGNTAGALTGSVAAAKRQEMVDEFSRIDGHAVLLSQIEAGGVGLNVQAASVVILAEPQWKPSTEAQAIARAHRMGQTRKVHVHRLLAKNSVDERMREIIEEKQQLFDEYARKSAAKEADARAVDSSLHQKVDVTRDEAVPAEQRIIAAERQRLGLDPSTR
ncbi:DEAD/DEAH box helicase [Lentzea californiensis]|uniref:DEAD/DEAH box helicase n=1 Tax=Lentzea californiensis TaxID=438851 RepID=UPI0021653FF4|nr:DEAD/DEAH box helicase [Lentzea californiensis]MCR3749376.1 SNF2 family N-terminal domain-containing protein [Lentzea californiensis]